MRTTHFYPAALLAMSFAGQAVAVNTGPPWGYDDDDHTMHEDEDGIIIIEPNFDNVPKVKEWNRAKK